MTEAQSASERADAVQLYLWELRDALDLRHWDVFLAAEAADEDCNASVHPVEGRWVAAVRLGPDFWNLDDQQKRSVLTHELLHLAHRNAADVVRSSLHASGYLPHRAYLLLWEQLRLELELMVDHLTTVIAPTMPAWTGRAER